MVHREELEEGTVGISVDVDECADAVVEAAIRFRQGGVPDQASTPRWRQSSRRSNGTP